MPSSQPPTSVYPTQARLARHALGWSLEAAAARAGVSAMTVRNFEAGVRVAQETRARLIAALVAGGARFGDDGGLAWVGFPPPGHVRSVRVPARGRGSRGRFLAAWERR